MPLLDPLDPYGGRRPSPDARPKRSILKKTSQFGPPPSPTAMIRLAPPRKRRRMTKTPQTFLKAPHTAPPRAAPPASVLKRKRALTRENVAGVPAAKRSAGSASPAPSASSASSVSSGSQVAFGSATSSSSGSKRKVRRPRLTAYEALAGRVSVSGRMPTVAELREHRMLLNQKHGMTFTGNGQKRLAKWIGRQQASTRDTLTRSTRPMHAWEVLLAKKNAPDRYEEPELDIWGAHRWLEGRTARAGDAGVREVYAPRRKVTKLQKRHHIAAPGEDVGSKVGMGGQGRMQTWAEEFSRMGQSQRDELLARDNARAKEQRDQSLPSPDLLKALHRYAALFYRDATGPWGTEATYTRRWGDERRNFRSFDESALLALGILIEETCKQELGETGWKGLLEPSVTKLSPSSEPIFAGMAKLRSGEHHSSKVQRANRISLGRESMNQYAVSRCNGKLFERLPLRTQLSMRKLYRRYWLVPFMYDPEPLRDLVTRTAAQDARTRSGIARRGKKQNHPHHKWFKEAMEQRKTVGDSAPAGALRVKDDPRQSQQDMQMIDDNGGEQHAEAKNFALKKAESRAKRKEKKEKAEARRGERRRKSQSQLSAEHGGGDDDGDEDTSAAARGSTLARAGTASRTPTRSTHEPAPTADPGSEGVEAAKQSISDDDDDDEDDEEGGGAQEGRRRQRRRQRQQQQQQRRPGVDEQGQGQGRRRRRRHAESGGAGSAGKANRVGREVSEAFGDDW